MNACHHHHLNSTYVNSTTQQINHFTTPNNPTTQQLNNPKLCNSTTLQLYNSTKPNNPTTQQPYNPTTRQLNNPTTRTTQQKLNRIFFSLRKKRWWMFWNVKICIWKDFKLVSFVSSKSYVFDRHIEKW